MRENDKITSMHRLINLFDQWLKRKADPIDCNEMDLQRRQAFFLAAPELTSLEGAYRVAVAWEKALKTVGVDSKPVTELPSTIDGFLRLRASDLTPEILKDGARFTKSWAKQIGARFTYDYAELVKRIHAKDKSSIEHIHPAFISDLMAAEYLLAMSKSSVQGSRQKGWLFQEADFVKGDLFMHTTILLDQDVPLASEWRLKSLKDSVLQAIVEARKGRAKQLCPPWLRRQDLLERMITDGFWPSGVNGNTTLSVRISDDMDIRDQMISFMKTRETEHYEATCLKGLIKRTPTEIVVACADTAALKKSLLRLYSREELLPYVKSDLHIKGMIVTEELGL
ncbi:hypothetical protein [Pseudomonas putida]|uniref:Uncharacterized protein n=1 Tax=Pseudomonas putida TaxID=303 RepID=A0A8I1JH83_PSEPU|nr:hypothetical protein [Pseudomonas putida]MBI6882411.1 hypothetical protein [Pseudomonas putida]